MKERSLLNVILVAVIVSILFLGWRFFAEKWNSSHFVQRWHLTLWVRLAIIAGIVLFVVWQFIPYQSVLK